MIIGFTGHRDCYTDPLALLAIYRRYPVALWVHGGAAGFDTQVNKFAKNYAIVVREILPDYGRYPPKQAPLARNSEIVAMADVLVACWDGRTKGGTYDTVNKAKRKGIEIVFVEAKPRPQGRR